CREALEQLCVVPTHLSLDLAGTLLGPGVEALAEAEQAGLVEVQPDRIAFRHELVRRAIEQSLPALRRRQLNAAVLGALRAGLARADPARLVHHAVAAGDAETIVTVAPQAARELARAGAHRQALAILRSVVPHLDRLAPPDRAAVLDDYGW